MKVQIKSDTRESVIYTVTLNKANKATACNCPAGRNGRKCKHLRRAEMKGQFKRASKIFMRAMTYSDIPEEARKEAFLSMFEAKKKRLINRHAREGINMAISKVIAIANLAVEYERPEICLAEIAYEKRVSGN